MDSDTEDESNSTGSSSVLRLAGLATLQQVPARVSLGKRGRESQNNPVKKKPYACATVQLCHYERVVGTLLNRSQTFRRPFARGVFASCVPVLIDF